MNVGAYYQVHNAIDAVDNLSWYYGGGVNAYFWNYKSTFIGDSSFLIRNWYFRCNRS
ncbi:MAG: hypothetical protein R2771_11975 [Saprospiraceae bacterium]